MKSGCLTVLLLIVTCLSLTANYIQYQSHLKGGVKPRPSCAPAAADMSGQIEAVAVSFGLCSDEGRQPCDLLSDLRLLADSAERAPTMCLPEKTLTELESVLTRDEIRTLKAGHAFLKGIGGRRVLIFKDEVEHAK